MALCSSWAAPGRNRVSIPLVLAPPTLISPAEVRALDACRQISLRCSWRLRTVSMSAAGRCRRGAADRGARLVPRLIICHEWYVLRRNLGHLRAHNHCRSCAYARRLDDAFYVEAGVQHCETDVRTFEAELKIEKFEKIVRNP